MGCGASKNEGETKTPTITPEADDIKARKSQTTSSDNKVIYRDEGTCWQHIDIDWVEKENPNSGWEDIIDLLRKDSPRDITPEKQRKGWKTVRLFVSSTFKDMHCEREHLVKKVFPRLRAWCEERKLHLIECDLRWGVPKNSNTRQTLMACLSELDRCREENILPYFVGMISERYGWVPTKKEVPFDIVNRYKWTNGVSVTCLEILVGAYWDNNPNGIFFLRDPQFVKDIHDKAILDGFVEKTQSGQESLVKIKGKLKHHMSDQVHEYNVTVDGVDGRKVNLAGLEQFGNKVFEHMKKQLSYQYPTDNIHVSQTIAEVQKEEHATYMLQRSKILLGRNDVVDQLQGYIHDIQDEPQPVVLVGQPGAGKSAVMAYIANAADQYRDAKTFYHFVGATPGSTELSQMIIRLWQETLPATEKIPADSDELKRAVATVIKKGSDIVKRAGLKKLVIILDALNQMDDDGSTHTLNWLPRVLPDNVRVIISTLPGKTLDSVRSGPIKLKEIPVEPLDVPVRKEIVTTILSEYNKKLDDEQLKKLVTKPDSGVPLWLTLACEELRIFGEFYYLDKKIEGLADDLAGLIEQVLLRIVEEFGDDIVIATVCLIECSRFGLREEELLELLYLEQRLPALPASSCLFQGKLPMAQWALAYLGLRQFLRPAGSSGQGRIDFYHRTISKAVRRMYLQNETDIKWWHERLVKYFQQSSNQSRRAEELPYHLQILEDKISLQACLTERTIFEELYNENSKTQLLAYWRFAADYVTASKLYIEELDTNYIKDLTSGDAEQIKLKVAWFLIDIGQYETSETLLQEGILKHNNRCGDALWAIVEQYYRRALKFVYGSHPGYRYCSQKGSEEAVKCYEINKAEFKGKMYNESDAVHFGEVLIPCGYFNREYLQEAEEIFDKFKYKQGLAVVYYMQCEKNQYSRNVDIPLEYIKKSLALCLSEFGPIHEKTARCYQLYGQLYWNQSMELKNFSPSEFKICLESYKNELHILEEILGHDHPLAVRSREDVIIIMEDKYSQYDEAKLLRDQQPSESADIA